MPIGWIAVAGVVGAVWLIYPTNGSTLDSAGTGATGPTESKPNRALGQLLHKTLRTRITAPPREQVVIARVGTVNIGARRIRAFMESPVDASPGSVRDTVNLLVERELRAEAAREAGMYQAVERRIVSARGGATGSDVQLYEEVILRAGEAYVRKAIRAEAQDHTEAQISAWAEENRDKIVVQEAVVRGRMGVARGKDGALRFSPFGWMTQEQVARRFGEQAGAGVMSQRLNQPQAYRNSHGRFKWVTLRVTDRRLATYASEEKLRELAVRRLPKRKFDTHALFEGLRSRFAVSVDELAVASLEQRLARP